jgi:hypothetical protein
MSFMQFQQRCEACRAEWNAAFGIVGRSIIAEPPVKCPKWGSKAITKIADEWKITPIVSSTEPAQ